MNEEHTHDHSSGHIHDHSHGHSHGDPFHPQLGAPLDTSEMDPANKSLAEALRLSFVILAILMAVLVLVFVASGAFKVNENAVAVVLRFGKLTGEIYEPGGPYAAFPKPIDQVLYVPTSDVNVRLEESFWFQVSPENKGKPLDEMPASNQLMPGRDGSLITGDRNIVHGQWTISYRVDKDHVLDFVRNVSADSNHDQMSEKAAERVRHAAERAIVHAVATVSSDEFIRSGGHDVGLNSQIKGLTQAKLDELKSGIMITTVSTSQPIPPLSVRAEFGKVTQASSMRATLEENAKKFAEKTLSDAAGPAHNALSLAIDYYEVARRDNDEADAERGLEAIHRLFDGTPSGEALAPLAADDRIEAARFASIDKDATLGGQASQVLNEARSYKRTAEEIVRVEAQQFTSLLADYPDKTSQDRYLSRRWYQVLENILQTDVTVSVQPKGSHVYLDINRDPRWEEYLKRKQFILDQAQDRANRSIMNTQPK